MAASCCQFFHADGFGDGGSCCGLVVTIQATSFDGFDDSLAWGGDGAVVNEFGVVLVGMQNLSQRFNLFLAFGIVRRQFLYVRK